jgi:hypothetical protein
VWFTASESKSPPLADRCRCPSFIDALAALEMLPDTSLSKAIKWYEVKRCFELCFAASQAPEKARLGKRAAPARHTHTTLGNALRPSEAAPSGDIRSSSEKTYDPGAVGRPGASLAGDSFGPAVKDSVMMRLKSWSAECAAHQKLALHHTMFGKIIPATSSHCAHLFNNAAPCSTLILKAWAPYLVCCLELVGAAGMLDVLAALTSDCIPCGLRGMCRSALHRCSIAFKPVARKSRQVMGEDKMTSSSDTALPAAAQVLPGPPEDLEKSKVVAGNALTPFCGNSSPESDEQ